MYDKTLKSFLKLCGREKFSCASMWNTLYGLVVFMFCLMKYSQERKKERKKGGSDGGHKHEWCVFLCLSCWPGHRCPEARQRSRGERWTLVYLHTLVYPQGLLLSSWNKSIFFTDQIPSLTDQRFLFYFKILKSHLLLPLLPFWISSLTGSWTITFP